MFDLERLPPALDAAVREMNPWWVGKPGPILPKFRRWVFEPTLRRLQRGLAPIAVLRGPRQVGKTTLQFQLIEHLIEVGQVKPSQILRIQFDEIGALRGITDPVLAIARWFENRVLCQSFNEAARAGSPAYLFFDEVQNLPDWAPQLKSLVDQSTVRVLVTGSSALRIELGRDSLAGRIAPIDLGTLLLREIAGLRFGDKPPDVLPDNGLEALLRVGFWRDLQNAGAAASMVRDRAFVAYSERGGYPMAQARADIGWAEIADQLNETVVRRAISHDLRIGQRGKRRDPQLLEEVFRLASIYTGQSPGQQVLSTEIRDGLRANIGWKRILTYLQFLEGAMLLRLVPPLELRLKRRKGSYKLAICDHGLRASWLQEVIPIDVEGLIRAPHLRDLAGHIVEGIVAYYLAGLPGLDLAHFPARGAEPEVDFVLTIGEHRIPMEVKYRQRVDPLRDTLALRAFLEKSVYNAPFGILVTQDDNVDIPDPRIVAVSLPSLLLMR